MQQDNIALRTIGAWFTAVSPITVKEGLCRLEERKDAQVRKMMEPNFCGEEKDTYAKRLGPLSSFRLH